MTVLTDTEIADRIRSGRRCLLCREDRRPGGTLCWTDHDELARILDPGYTGERLLERAPSIPQLWTRLDPAPGRGGPGRRAPGFRSQPPLSLDKVVMRDVRSVSYPVVDVWFDPLPGGVGEDWSRPHWEDESPPRSVEKVVTGLVDMLWDDLGYEGPIQLWRSVAECCGWLHAHLEDLTARDDADEVFRDLSDLHVQLAAATGSSRDRKVADCTGWVRDRDTGEKVECGAPLRLPPPDPGVEVGPARPPKLDPRKPVIRCQRCDRPYTYLMLLRQEISQEAS